MHRGGRGFNSHRVHQTIMKIKIVYQDKDILVIEKPANLTVHPAKERQENTLADQLVNLFPEIKGVGEDPLRPGIVHRLDKDTSGLMVIAKNNQVFNFLKEQFAQRKVVKRYLALVFGKVKDKKGTITKSISLSNKDHRKRSALLDEKSKPAWTEYNVLESFSDYSLLEVKIKTGRTHQIRIHLASIGHPVVGDKQYKFKRQTPPRDLDRQFLHASYLKFKLPNGKMMEFKSELPDDLKEVLESIL
ncbi:MAG: RluA family pseudouridine synthase [Candidatus Portnoybacteria bacterium]